MAQDLHTRGTDDSLDETRSAETRSAETSAELTVRLSADRTEVILDCPAPLCRLDANIGLILAEFDALGLPNYPDRQTLRTMLREMAAEGQDLVNQVLIRGKKPIQPVHGTWNWSRDYFAEGWVIDEETDSIDFREKISNCSVRRNELLVRRFAPREGESGCDVYGNSIPVPKAETGSLRCGKGIIETTEEGVTNFFAEYDGRVTFKENVVAVDEVYAINGDVDLGSGNIHHTGTITVSGDIRNGYLIETDGDIVVKGLVEQCNIRCGGNLIVAGGIIGDAEHTITVGGDVEAKYIRDAHLRADGDIFVVREISYSNVGAQGLIKVPKGRIVGGNVSALRGINVATAGATSGAYTILRAGVDFSLQERVDLFLEKIARLEASLAPVEAALKNVECATGTQSAAASEIRENLHKKRMLIGQSITMEYMNIEELTANTERVSVPSIIMTRTCWSGTTIYLGEAKVRVKQSFHKPRIAVLKGAHARVVPLGEANMPEGELSS